MNDESQIKRNLELAAYFTKPLLERPHRQLTLMNAMRLAVKHKNFVHATHFADRILANNSTGKNAETVSRTNLSRNKNKFTLILGLGKIG